MREAVDDGLASMRQALAWHLGSNHYPPIHHSFVESALNAISAVDAEDYDEVILLPNGIELTASTIVEELHLDSFLNSDDLDFDADGEDDDG
jgi:hypothetical protein